MGFSSPRGPVQRARLPAAGIVKPNNCAATRLSVFGKSVNSEDDTRLSDIKTKMAGGKTGASNQSSVIGDQAKQNKTRVRL